MKAFVEVMFCLSQKFAGEQDGGGGAVTGDVVLSSCGSSNHNSCGVLDLHFVQENVAVLGDLDLAGATHKHF